MRRPLLIALAVLLACSGNAQSWCPPGATWTYGTAFISLYGYAQYAYVSDTMLNGQLAHRIDAQGAMSYFGQTQVDQWSQPVAAITAQIGDVVSLWSDTDQDWDTLFWLGSGPGDGWIRADGPYGPCTPPDSLVIVDTTTVVYGGLPLKRWTVEQRSYGTTTFTETFTERLGWTMNFSPYPACLIVDGPVGMRCYSDQDIDVNFTSYGCGTLVGMSDRDRTSPLSVHPTPGHDRFILELPPGRHTLLVTDLAGRTVHTGPVETGVPVDASRWPAGTYVLRLPELGRSLRWMKE